MMKSDVGVRVEGNTMVGVGRANVAVAGMDRRLGVLSTKIGPRPFVFVDGGIGMVALRDGGRRRDIVVSWVDNGATMATHYDCCSPVAIGWRGEFVCLFNDGGCVFVRLDEGMERDVGPMMPLFDVPLATEGWTYQMVMDGMSDMRVWDASMAQLRSTHQFGWVRAAQFHPQHPSMLAIVQCNRRPIALLDTRTSETCMYMRIPDDMTALACPDVLHVSDRVVCVVPQRMQNQAHVFDTRTGVQLHSLRLPYKPVRVAPCCSGDRVLL